MEVTYDVTAEEIFALTNHMLTKGRSTTFPKMCLYISLFFGVLFVITLVISSVLQEMDFNQFVHYIAPICAIIQCVAGGLAYVFLILYFVSYFATRSRCRSIARLNQHIYLIQHLMLTSEGISHRSTASRSVFYWHAIKKIALRTRAKTSCRPSPPKCRSSWPGRNQIR